MRCVDSSGVCANEWWFGGLDRDVELVARLNYNDGRVSAHRPVRVYVSATSASVVASRAEVRART
jgi:hypothetical protein